MKKSDIKIGDRVILTENYDGLVKGSEGIVKHIPTTYVHLEITKKIGTVSLHTCDGSVKSGKGWSVLPKCIELIKNTEPDIPKIDMDFGDICSDSIESFLSKR